MDHGSGREHHADPGPATHTKKVVASTTAPYLCLHKSGPELWPPCVHHWSHDTQ